MTICLLWSLAQADGKTIFAVEQQSLTGALTQFAEQTGLQLVYPSRLTAGIETAVTEAETPEDMLEQLLAGTDLMYEYLNANTITLREKPKPPGVNTMSYQANSINNPSPRPTLFKRITTLVAGAMLASPAIAADETTDEGESYIEEIVVTAERREESILDVPLAITAFSGETMERLGMTNSDDLEQFVPGLQYGDTGEHKGFGIVMRGIGTFAAVSNHADLGVASYVDGVYTLGLYGAAPNYWDLERIEVARGPQGTLHGRNSIGGSISYFHKKPTFDWDAKVLAEFTDQTTQRVNLAIGGPVPFTDYLAFRVTGSRFSGDGAQKNIGVGEDNAKPDETTWSAQLRLKTDRLDVNVRKRHVDDEGVPRTVVLLSNIDNSEIICVPVPEEVLIEGINQRCDTSPFYLYDEPLGSIEPDCPIGVPGFRCGDLKNVINHNEIPVAHSESDQMSLSIAFDVTNMLTLNYVYGDFDVQNQVARDGDYMNRTEPAPGWIWGLQQAFGGYIYEEKSHELRLTSNFEGPLNFIVGAYSYDSEDVSNTGLINAHDPAVGKTADEWAQQSFPVDLSFIDPSLAMVDVDSCQEFLTEVWDPWLAAPFDSGTSTPGPISWANLAFTSCPEGTLGPGDFKPDDIHDAAAVETEAAFASIEYQFDEKWLVSGGLRYTKDTKRLIASQINGTWDIGGRARNLFGWPLPEDFVMPVRHTAIFAEEPKTDRWSHTIGHVTVEYTPDSDVMWYGRLSTGYRAGSFNTGGVGLQATDIRVKKETLTNYEVGVKGLFMDRRLQLMSALFYNDYDDYQVEGATVLRPEQIAPGGDPIAFMIKNVSGTSIWGLETEGVYQFNEQWSLSGFYAYLGSSIGPVDQIPTSMLGAGNLGRHTDELEWDVYVFTGWGYPLGIYYPLPKEISGNELPQQPKHKFGLSLTHTRSLGELGTLELVSNYSYTGERWSTILNTAFYQMPDYGRLDLRASWRSADEAWSATLFVQNALDEIALVDFVPGDRGNFIADPTQNNQMLGTLTEGRQVGLQLRWQL